MSTEPNTHGSAEPFWSPEVADLLQLQMETQQLLTRAAHVEDRRAWEAEDIDAAHAKGLTVEEYHHEISPDPNDFDWTDEQEGRAAGHPAYQDDDYEPPGLREAWEASGVATETDEEWYYAEGHGERLQAGYDGHRAIEDIEAMSPDERAARFQEETFAYAIGDDLVVGGVAYDSTLWQNDGEGGVEPRLSAEDELARQVTRAEVEESNDRNREADFDRDDDYGM